MPNAVVVRGFSRERIGFATSANFEIGSEITIGLSGGGSVNGLIVRRHCDLCGCVFAVRPISTGKLRWGRNGGSDYAALVGCRPPRDFADFCNMRLGVRCRRGLRYSMTDPNFLNDRELRKPIPRWWYIIIIVAALGALWGELTGG